MIDWNGDVFLCPQDWQRRQTMGNMMQEEIFDIWTSKIMKKYRVDLLDGKRCNNLVKIVMLKEHYLVLIMLKNGEKFIKINF